MTTGYSKLSGNLINSSVWDEPDSVRIVWITLLAMCDAAGMVEASLSGLAHQARKSREETQEAVRVLESPDNDSKNPDHEGRRIAKVEGGWLILNYVLYRAQQEVGTDPEIVATRLRVQRYRERKRKEKALALHTVTEALHTVTGVTSASASASASVSFLEELKRNPFNAGVDIDRELENAKRWCKNKNRRCTQRFFEKWVARADRLVPDPPKKAPPKTEPAPEVTHEQRVALSNQMKELVGKFKMP